MKTKWTAAGMLLLLVSIVGPLRAQDNPPSGPHPLTVLMKTVPSGLKRELRGRHPRVYVTEEGLAVLKQRARSTHRELWQRALAGLRLLKGSPPAAPAQDVAAQTEVALALAEAALAYKIEGDPRYLEAARRYMDTAASYAVWGDLQDQPNAGLPAGQLLYGLGWGYDLLYWDLKEEERKRYSDALARHARLLAAAYQPTPGRLYAYNRSRVYAPLAGLAVAAYALYDEIEDAPEWARLARAVFDRVLATYTADGFDYEGFENWAASAPWILHYMDAQAQATGEDLFDRPGLRRMHAYAAHSTLPGGKQVFDFGTSFEGSLTRSGIGAGSRRTHPGGNLVSNYNVLYRLASRFAAAEPQGVAAWLKSQGQLNAEECWSLLWYDPEVPALPIDQLKPWHYFEDHEVVFWRTDWSAQATALAFKCGPPQGHRALSLLQELGDWQPVSASAHPDANSFILFARGKYLSGDSGGSGLPTTDQHNTLLVGGRGQAREGAGRDAFNEVPYTRLNGIRIADMRLGPGLFYAVGDAAAAYDPESGVTRFDRQLLFAAPDSLIITDDVAAKKPQLFSMLLHSDTGIKPAGGFSFALGEGTPSLLATVVLPAVTQARLEPNLVTSVGPPGAPEKGERQPRGNRVAISTAEPAEQARFITLLRIQ